MKSSFVLLAGFLLGFVCLGYADDGAFSGYPQSGTVFPLKNEYIQMISEVVIYKDEQFTTTFEFLNTSNKEQEVTIGFPVVGNFQFSGDTVDEEPKNEEERLQKISNYYQFKSFIDGKEIERTLKKLSEEYANEEYQYVFISKYKFPALKKVVVKNIYRQKEGYGVSIDGFNTGSIDYILETGALWKGRIERAKVVFYLKNASGYDNTYSFDPHKNEILKYYVSFSPKCSMINEENGYLICEWDFKDFKPTDNIYVSWGRESMESVYYDTDILIVKGKLETYLKGEEEIIIKASQKYFIEMQDEEIFHSYINSLAALEPKSLSENRVKFIVNSLYALKGYKFNKPEWSKFYKNFMWYKPVTDKPEFSQEEKDLIAKLTKLEKENAK